MLRKLASVGARRDRWMDACGAAAFVSLSLIIGYVACRWIAGIRMPYSGGGAVVLGIGATLCLGLESASARLAASIGLVGLMLLRMLAALRPDLIAAEHGALSVVDGGGVALLILAAAWMVLAATRRPDSESNKARQPADSQSGAGA